MKISEYHEQILKLIEYPPEGKNGDYLAVSNGGFTMEQLEYLLNWLKSKKKIKK